jgi:DAK2 domain fusion protein YloV
LDVITGNILRNMLLYAGAILNQEKDRVNSLNVFPVPDGDTGTNMSLTLNAALKEVEKVESTEVNRITAALARGSLMGARGNSGVILSQFFRGFADGLSEVVEAATGRDLARAFEKASQTTYRAVMKPVEGTMLTVGREAATAALATAEENESAAVVLKAAFDAASQAVLDSPKFLPVLKEAGVVDAGGQGLLCIFEGLLRGMDGEPAEYISEPVEAAPEPARQEGITRINGVLVNKYCTEFLVLGQSLDPDHIRDTLEEHGESMLVVGDERVVKVHIHTDHPGKVLEFCGSLGDLSDIKIDNMQLQNEAYTDAHNHDFFGNVVEFPKQSNGERKDIGVVAVVPGKGLAEIFMSLGADSVVLGGQTMNPSTEDLLKAVESVNADAVIILPNNKNVIFSANQVRELCEKPVGVVATRSVPQGITALMYFEPEASLEENLEAMDEHKREVKTGEITYAVRATVAGDLQIDEKDIIGLTDGKIAVVGQSVADVAHRLIEAMVDEDSSVISLYYGEDQAAEEAAQLHQELSEKYPHCEVEVHSGGQPLYYYIISVE